MLVEVQVWLRSFKHDGSPVTGDEYALLGPTGSYAVEGLGEEERSVNLIGCSLKLDSFKGRAASERFWEAARTGIDSFALFLNSIDDGSFKSFLARGINSDLLMRFTIDENMMDFEISRNLVFAASRLGVSISILVNPE